MNRRLKFTPEARENLEALNKNPGKSGVLKQVLKTLALMETDLRHPSLNTHEFSALSCSDYKVFEAYAQNDTSGAYRVFWRYGPDDVSGKTRIPVITVLAITPHP